MDFRVLTRKFEHLDFFPSENRLQSILTTPVGIDEIFDGFSEILAKNRDFIINPYCRRENTLQSIFAWGKNQSIQFGCKNKIF